MWTGGAEAETEDGGGARSRDASSAVLAMASSGLAMMAKPRWLVGGLGELGAVFVEVGGLKLCPRHDSCGIVQSGWYSDSGTSCNCTMGPDRAISSTSYDFRSR
jgi:hypothetical protein